MEINFTELKIIVQLIIDNLAKQDKEAASLKISQAKELLDDLTDCASSDDDLIELSRYQVLINQLQLKAQI